ncbi:MAG: hypothetical protein H0U00_08105 [Actinobacteria bacterium]|nr:hypothetical protein [Actinomycetota bacterium]
MATKSSAGAQAVPEPRKNKFGPLRVLQRTDGKHIVYDSRLPPGARTVFLTDSFESAREYAVRVSGVTEGEDSTGNAE